MFPTTYVLQFSYFLATALFKTNKKSEGNITDIFYVIEYNMTISQSLVHHRTRPFQKTHWLQDHKSGKNAHSFLGFRLIPATLCSLWQESVCWAYIDVPQLAVHRNWFNHWRHLSTFFESQRLNMWHNVLGAIIGWIIPIMQYCLNSEFEQSRQCCGWEEVFFYNAPWCAEVCWSQGLLKEQVKERCYERSIWWISRQTRIYMSFTHISNVKAG